MKATTFALLERILIAVILISMLTMFQPWSRDVYARGFLVLLFSTFAYIILSHIKIKED